MEVIDIAKDERACSQMRIFVENRYMKVIYELYGVIKNIKAIKGVTIRQLARITGISRSVIGRI